ncbi:hydroxymethylglutaryl-CoA lyase [Peribacillus kribbensis]|uniref:hydroxymethylglutaryl-CoA lyase n=1 Tax=Peribacillus kribbensis TaxID=356658 RepID=UPI000415ED58|nr:hydroxymethylglutaryl-CoA lyase [Peribacillus kribbensis]
MTLPLKVNIVEVGPRDGLQNEAEFIPTDKKIELINSLNQTGLKRMEAASFVHPLYVPQMKDARAVLQGIEHSPDVQYMALVPNAKGYERALENGVKAVSLVVGASDSFNRNNVKMSREESLRNFEAVVKDARKNQIFIRYNIATSFWCPFEGRVEEKAVLEMVQEIDSQGVDEIVICDTIGRANPKQTAELFSQITAIGPRAAITAHLHDTYGFALANILAALKEGVTSFDTSIGGLGGCPFAPGAAGNAATEDVVFMLHEMGIETGIDIDALKQTLEIVKPLTKRELTGRLHKVQACAAAAN